MTTTQVVVTFRSELDVRTAPRLAEQLAELADDGVPHLDLYLDQLTVIDATVLAVIIAAAIQARSSGGETVLRTPTYAVE